MQGSRVSSGPPWRRRSRSISVQAGEGDIESTRAAIDESYGIYADNSDSCGGGGMHVAVNSTVCVCVCVCVCVYAYGA